MPTVAEQLRAGREAHGLTVHQVAEITKIKTEHVRALEEGNYKAFAAPVYIRGFVRTYARILHMDPESTVAAADTELRQTGIFEDATASAGTHRGVIDVLMLQLSKVNWRVALPALGIGLAAVLTIVAYRGWSEYRHRDPLSDLGPGQYQPASPEPAETLPLPPVPGRK